MSDSFYRAFEDRHRGSRELIKSRLAAYLPFLVPLTTSRTPTALDLGCGRGEWLELLGESGFVASGVDLDEGMLEACRDRGLNVKTEDAITALRAQPDASLALISAFHLVEHIPFDSVQELISQALRALEPGGILIMETPNPENLVVATSGFYMDPSHLRPIPPMLLEFVVEFAGFARQRIVRLQESPQLHQATHLDLMNVLNGASPDYSVVAQKAAELIVSAPFDPAFTASYGLDLATLAQRYQAQQDALRSQSQAGLAQITERIAAAELSASGLFQRTLETISEAQAATRQAQSELNNTQQRERALEAAVHAQALKDAETRAAAYLSQAQEASARAMAAEELAREANRLRAEQEASAHAMAAEKLAREATRLRAEQEASVHAINKLEELTREVNSLRAEQGTVHERHASEIRQLIDEHARQTAIAHERLTSAASSETEELKRYAENTEQSRAAAEAHAQHLQWRLNEMTVRLMATEQHISDVLASSSWRVTRPMRVAMTLLRRPLGKADVQRMVEKRSKARPGNLVVPLLRVVTGTPATRAFALRTLAHFPRLERRLRALAQPIPEAVAPAPTLPASAEALLQPGQSAVKPPPNISRSAQNILAQLQRRIDAGDHTET